MSQRKVFLLNMMLCNVSYCCLLKHIFSVVVKMRALVWVTSPLVTIWTKLTRTKQKLSHDDKWLSKWLTLARNHPLKALRGKFSRKLHQSFSCSRGRLSRRVSFANDIQAWLIFYTLIGLTLEVLSRDACVFIKFTCFCWRDIESTVTLMYSHILNLSLGLINLHIYCFNSFAKEHIKISFLFPPYDGRWKHFPS